MTTEDAIKKRDELNARFDSVYQEKADHESKAEELATELLKLQGEYRLLVELFPEAEIKNRNEDGLLTDTMELSEDEQKELDEAKARLAAKVAKRGK